MILAICISLLSSYIYLKRAGQAKSFRIGKTGYYLENILFMILLAELISRGILHHSSLFIVLIYTVPDFGKKFMVVLFFIAVMVPFLRNICMRLYKIMSLLCCKLTSKSELRHPVSEIVMEPVYEKLIFMGAGVSAFCVLILGTGSLWSGYHLVDDHVFISIADGLRTQFLPGAIRAQIVSDLSIRFRPLYNVEIVVKTYLFGTNMFWWMLASMVEGIFTFYFLCLSGRNMRATRLEAILFAGLILFGRQFTPWYRAANQENEGMLLVAVVMFLITELYAGHRAERIHPGRYYAGIVVTGILSSMQKEAFVLMLPAYFGFMLVMDKAQNPTKSFDENFRSKIGVFVSYLIAFTAEIYMIVFQVGTNQIGYAGFSSQSPLMSYLSGIVTSITVNMKQVSLTGGLAVIVLTIYIIAGRHYKKLFIYKGYILLAGYIMVTQLILHAKSGMWERYMLPYMVGWAILFVIVIFRMLRSNWILYFGYMALCFSLLISGMKYSFQGAKGWASDGKNTGALLSTLNEILSDYKTPKIMVDFGGNVEYELAVQVWEAQYGQYKWYNHTIEADTIGKTGIADSDFDVLVTYTTMFNEGQGTCDILNQCIDKEKYRSIEIDDNYLVAVRDR